MINFIEILEKYKNKRVFITGNTGFKGSWLTKILLNAGANILGYALKPATEPNLFNLLNLEQNPNLHQIYGDIRDIDLLKNIFCEFKPEFVFHLAAQPIVKTSYTDPVNTYSINVMGTVNICECVRMSALLPIIASEDIENHYCGVKSFLNVTTDKVYKNFEWEYGYREIDPLDGYDPYSNSKSCSELVTHSYNDSFFKKHDIRVSTARAGNVIGGGDFSSYRIIPDCIKTVKSAFESRAERAEIHVRNPLSVRPYQHVLEPLFAYLMIAMKQYEDKTYAGYYNVGPDDTDCVTTGDLVDLFCKRWNENWNRKPIISWKSVVEKDAPYEASFLKLDTSKLKTTFRWKPCWNINEAIEQTINWTTSFLNGYDLNFEMDKEIEKFSFPFCDS